MSKPRFLGTPANVRPAERATVLEPLAQALAAAQAVLLAGLNIKQPEYLRDRYQRLAAILDMLEDPGWVLPPADRQRILNVLSGFALASAEAGMDHVTLMELASRELRHDLDAYHAYCRLRSAAAQRQSPHDADRAHWLAERRDALQLRMRQLRERDQDSSGGTWRRWRSLLNL